MVLILWNAMHCTVEWCGSIMVLYILTFVYNVQYFCCRWYSHPLWILWRSYSLGFTDWAPGKSSSWSTDSYPLALTEVLESISFHSCLLWVTFINCSTHMPVHSTASSSHLCTGWGGGGSSLIFSSQDSQHYHLHHSVKTVSMSTTILQNTSITVL